VRLRGKVVGTLSEADLQALVDNGVAESRLIEYKSELPGGADRDRKDFLADVSAFANSGGGCLVYGIETQRDANKHDTGIPVRLKGLPDANVDQTKQRLESMLQDGLSPPLRSFVQFQSVASSITGDPVLVVGVPSSFAAPHRVVFQKINRFWRRSETGNYEPEMTELKRMFLESTTWSEEAEQFRLERIEKIRVRRTVNANVNSSVFIHALPLGRLGSHLDLKPHERKMIQTLAPPGGGSWSSRFGVDGYMTYTTDSTGQLESYTQWFRFGGIEGYAATFVRNYKGHGQEFPILQARALTVRIENYVVEAIKALVDVFEHTPPFGIGVSVHGVNGAYIVVEEGNMGKPIDQNEIVTPLVVLEDSDPAKIRTALKPIVDILWQSGGFPEEPRARSFAGNSPQ
jgi:hypothetical protein